MAGERPRSTEVFTLFLLLYTWTNFCFPYLTAEFVLMPQCPKTDGMMGKGLQMWINDRSCLNILDVILRSMPEFSKKYWRSTLYRKYYGKVVLTVQVYFHSPGAWHIMFEFSDSANKGKYPVRHSLSTERGETLMKPSFLLGHFFPAVVFCAACARPWLRSQGTAKAKHRLLCSSTVTGTLWLVISQAKLPRNVWVQALGMNCTFSGIGGDLEWEKER